MTSEAVEMSEQTPLKSDTDAKPEGEAAADEAKKEGFGAKFTKLFSRAPKKEGEMTEEKKDAPPVENGEKKCKKWTTPKWLQCNKEACEKADVQINMTDRDERATNEHLKLDFGDILAEPDGMHSFDCAWRLTARTFTCVRSIIYKLLALIIAIPCAIIWGILFALVTVLNVWLATPAARCLTIPALWLAKAWNFLVRSLLDPLHRSFGLCLSSIHIRRYGMSNDATAEMA